MLPSGTRADIGQLTDVNADYSARRRAAAGVQLTASHRKR
jgi:hypothetical protein